MTAVQRGRFTANIDALGDEVVVFMIGTRINKPWKVRTWWPGFIAMPKMLKYLSEHPEKGLLAYEQAAFPSPIIVQYWRSFDDLARFARDRDDPHLEPWRQFNKRVGSSGDVGIWHETYRVNTSSIEHEWLPNKHLEISTLAAYRSYLNKQFYPAFGTRPLNKLTPTLIQDWVTTAKHQGLSPRSIRKYHVLLSSIFRRAVADQILVRNPCEHTELPKVIARKSPTLTPDEFDQLISAVPERYRLMVETFIETGMRWGELIALRPRHIDFLRRTLTVEETIVEISKTHSPTGQRFIGKPYPKDNEPRTFGVRQDWLDAIAELINTAQIGRDDLLFTTKVGTPISRNSFRTHVWPQPSKPAASTTRSASTTCATPTPPGSWPAAPTSSP